MRETSERLILYETIVLSIYITYIYILYIVYLLSGNINEQCLHAFLNWQVFQLNL